MHLLALSHKLYRFFPQFYADDRSDSSDVITTHSFHSVESARYVRILASSGVRWIGHEEKCFRFELLGCEVDSEVARSWFEADVGFQAETMPSGFIATR